MVRPRIGQGVVVEVPATTANLGADIVAVSRSRGLFAGVALDGTILSSRSEWNSAYYGQELSARQIVVNVAAHNPGADPLRAVLGRYGSAASVAAPVAESSAPPPASTSGRSSRRAVTRAPLAPPPR